MVAIDVILSGIGCIVRQLSILMVFAHPFIIIPHSIELTKTLLRYLGRILASFRESLCSRSVNDHWCQ